MWTLAIYVLETYVVIIADKNVRRALRGEYRLKTAFPGDNGKVRRVLVTYKNFHGLNNQQDYYGISEAVTVSRSAQRLVLLVPVEVRNASCYLYQ
jgi:hypothetical protein